MLRIAFCGPSGSGKSTFAEYLAKHHGFTRVSNFLPLRQATKRMVEAWNQRLPEAYRVDVDNKDDIVDLFIAAGVGFREVDPYGLPVALLHRHGLIGTTQTAGAVCDDIRSKEEADVLKSAGFIVIRLEASPESCVGRVQNRDGGYNDILKVSPLEASIREVQHTDGYLWKNETEDDRAQIIDMLDTLVMQALTNVPDDAYAAV